MTNTEPYDPQENTFGKMRGRYDAILAERQRQDGRLQLAYSILSLSDDEFNTLSARLQSMTNDRLPGRRINLNRF